MIDPKTIKNEWLRKLIEPLYNKSGSIPCPYQPVAPQPDIKNQKEPVDGLLDNVEHSILPPSASGLKSNIQPLVAVPDKNRPRVSGRENIDHSVKKCKCCQT